MTQPTFLVQITDLHIREPGRLAYGRLDTGPFLARAVQSILALRQKPAAVVATGDLTDFGRAAEYRQLADLLAPLGLPLYLMPGNHDDRDALRRAFPEHGYLGISGFIQYSVAVGGLRLVVLDSADAGHEWGRLTPERLAWLEDELASRRDEPVVVALHHPPFRTLIGHMDRIGLVEGAAALEAIVARHPNVQRVICGHLHRSITTRFGGTVALTAPSTAHQVCLDLADDAPSAWCLDPPGFCVHAWDGERMTTHLAAIGPFPGPFPFHEPGGQLID